jgi:hypothetical protein
VGQVPGRDRVHQIGRQRGVDNVPTLEAIRTNARIQIDVMQEVAILQFLRLNANALQGTISTLQGFRLAALTGSRVCRLVGVAEPGA